MTETNHDENATGTEQAGDQRAPRDGQPAGDRRRPSQDRQPVDDGQRGRQGGHRGDRTDGSRNVRERPRGYESSPGTGLDSNVAAALSYLLGWVTGLVFFVIEKEDEFVRFHAAQSIVVFGALTVGWYLFSSVLASLLFSTGPVPMFGVLQLFQLGGLILWVLLLYMAHDGRWFRVPIAADIADSLVASRDRPVQPRQYDRGPSAEHRQPEGHQQPPREGQSEPQQRSTPDQ